MRTDTRESDSSNIFVVIEQVPKDQVPYSVENQLDDADIGLELPMLPARLPPPPSSLPFSWESPSQLGGKGSSSSSSSAVREVTVEIVSTKYHKEVVTFSPDRVSLYKKIRLRPLQSGSKPKYIKLTIEINGFVKLLKFQPCKSSDHPEELLRLKDLSLQKQLKLVSNSKQPVAVAAIPEDEQEEEEKKENPGQNQNKNNLHSQQTTQQQAN